LPVTRLLGHTCLQKTGKRFHWRNDKRHAAVHQPRKWVGQRSTQSVDRRFVFNGLVGAPVPRETAVSIKPKRRTAAAPKSHHLDRRVGQLLQLASSADLPDDGSDALLTTKQVAAWLGVSDQWLEVGRIKGYGPPYIRLSPRGVRYKRGAVLKWLKQRRMVAPG
jgi:hypothetical protein